MEKEEARERPRIVVIGGANMDIGGMPAGPLIDRDSNPGRVRFSVGGVGRNIAHNLRLLGLPVTFLTALGRDERGDRIAAECALAGMDCERILRTEKGATSVYLYISDGAGEMRLAISDMEICRLISPAYLEEQQELLARAAAVVVDANLPEESLRYLAENCPAPLFADPVSVQKAVRLEGILERVHTLKPNLLEAELLSGVRIRGGEDLSRAAEALLDRGVRRVFISLGEKGVFAAEQGRQALIPRCSARVRNTTGAGDALMAGLVYAHTREAPLEESARIAAAAAAIAVEGEETVNPAMSEEALQEKIRKESGA